MTGVEPRTSGIGSDRSTNWATQPLPKDLSGFTVQCCRETATEVVVNSKFSDSWTTKSLREMLTKDFFLFLSMLLLLLKSSLDRLFWQSLWDRTRTRRRGGPFQRFCCKKLFIFSSSFFLLSKQWNYISAERKCIFWKNTLWTEMWKMIELGDHGKVPVWLEKITKCL